MAGAGSATGCGLVAVRSVRTAGRKPANRTAKEMTTRALGAGSEACSLAEGAGGDRRGGPAGRADRECGDAEQGDADVAEQGERLDSGDGAGVNALEHRR